MVEYNVMEGSSFLNFRKALFISISVHLIVLSSWRPIYLERPIIKDEFKKQPELNYIYESKKDMSIGEPLHRIPKRYDIKRKDTEFKNRKVFKQDAKKQREKKNRIQKDVFKKSRSKSEDRAENHTIRKETQNTLSKEDVENIEEYISYYELLRENIKKALSQLYKDSKENGSIHVVFILHKDGNLEGVWIDETRSANSRYLREITLKSVRNSAPYPPFPETLNRDYLTFSIPVIFKRR